MARRISPSIAVVLALLAGQPAPAQAPSFDNVGLYESCLRGSCVSAVQARISQIRLAGLSPAEFNSQLGVIAAVLLQAASRADEDMIARLAEALQLLAQFSTDPAQRQSFIWVAGQISNGAADLFDLQAPFAVSPS